MAILAPDTMNGIIPLGTSMDFESQRSRDPGCWDGISFCTPAIDALAKTAEDDWAIPIELVDAVLKEGLGHDMPPDERTSWHATHQKNYTGDTGRKRVRISSINLRDATACTAGSTACDAPSRGCTAPKTRSTPSPTPRMR